MKQKKITLNISYQVPAYCITHAQPNSKSNPDAEGWELSVITTTLPSLQQCIDKMSYLNQMYEKKAMARAWAFAWLASTDMEVWNGIWKKILVWNGRFLVWNGNGRKLPVWNMEKSSSIPFHTMPWGLDNMCFLLWSVTMLSIKYIYWQCLKFQILFSQKIFIIEVLTGKRKLFFFWKSHCSTCVGRSLRLFLS